MTQDRYLRLGSDVNAELGRGAYGYVVPAWDTKERRLVVMKRQKVELDEAGREIVFFNRMASAKSFHLMELIDMFVESC